MQKNSNTAAWKFQVWASFVISCGTTAIGIAYLPVDLWTKGFIGMGLLFTVGSCFSLAKTIRDDFESDKRGKETVSTPNHPFRNAA
ncbi:MAG: YiaA/YiaB family inner membrane protein [Myxococcota bacterium]